MDIPLCEEPLSTPNSPCISQRSIGLSIAERQCICATWEKASSECDIGCELVARLLNDNRSRFRALLESKLQGSSLDNESYTTDDVNGMSRARSVATGVNCFFNKAISKLMDANYIEEIQVLSLQLGAMHFRMKVWFQAENWLCVKNCLLDSVVCALIKDAKGSYICGGVKRVQTVEKNVTHAWFKFVQFIIQNMKKGFLSEALNSDSNNGPKTECESPCSSTSNNSL